MKVEPNIDIGDFVFSSKFNKCGTVVNINYKTQKIKLTLDNDFLVSVSYNEVSKLQNKLAKVVINENFNQKNYLLEKKAFADFHTEIDLHGYRASEAIEYLENFVEKAIYYGEKNLIVIHGKGSGILREIVKNFVKRNKFLSLAKVPSHICEYSAICIQIK